MKLEPGHLDTGRWVEEDDYHDQPSVAGPDWFVRQQSMSRLEDQTEIAHVARTDPDCHVRIVALLRLQDPALVDEIARHDPNETVRKVAALCASWRMIEEPRP